MKSDRREFGSTLVSEIFGRKNVSQKKLIIEFKRDRIYLIVKIVVVVLFKIQLLEN